MASEDEWCSLLLLLLGLGFLRCFGLALGRSFSAFGGSGLVGLSLIITSFLGLLFGADFGNLLASLLSSESGTNLGGSLSKLLLGGFSNRFSTAFSRSSFSTLSSRLFTSLRLLSSSWLLVLLNLSRVSSLRHSVIRSIGLDLRNEGLVLAALREELLHSSRLSFHLNLSLLEKADLELVVDEGDDHLIVEGDHVRGHVVRHLLHALHEYEGAVGREAVLTTLSDGPALLLRERDGTVISRDSLQLDLNVTLHGATKRVHKLLVLGANVDLVLDVIDVLISTDPGGSSSQLRIVILIEIVGLVRRSHEVELVRGLLGGNLLVRGLVEVIVHDLAKIDYAALLDLNLAALVKLNARCVHKAEITDVVLTVLVDDHELSLPQLLVIGDLVMVLLALTNLKDATVTLKLDFNILELGRVDALELQLERLLRKLSGSEDHLTLLQQTGRVDILTRHILERKLAKSIVLVLEVLETRVVVNHVGGADRVLRAEHSSLELGLVEAQLMLERAVAILIEGLLGKLFNDINDGVGIAVNADHVVLLHHDLMVQSLVLGEVILSLVDLAELAERLKEFVSSASLLGLEERQPEDLSVNAGSELVLNIVRQAVVDDVLEVDGVELVGPGMKNLEALVIHILLSESFDILLDELKVSLVGLDGVAQVVLVDRLLVVTQEATDSLDARGRLEVLRCEQLVQLLLERRAIGVGANLESRKDAHEHLLEALEVPVLVDDGVNNARKEDLLSLVGKKVHEVVHRVNLLEVVLVVLAPLRQKLLSKQEDQVADVLVVREVNVLARVLEAYLDFVHERAADRDNHGLGIARHATGSGSRLDFSCHFMNNGMFETARAQRNVNF